MSNTIKLKRGSGSDPSASDLVLGELAIRTDNGKIFLKKDDGNVAEVSGGGIDDGDKGDITVSSSGATWTIDSGAVTESKIGDNSITLAKMGNNSVGADELISGSIVNAKINSSAAIAYSKLADISANRVLGRVNAGAVEATQVHTGMIADDAVTAAKLASNAVVNGSVDASAAIAGTKISPDFGSQDIATTGQISGKDLILSDTTPVINFNDSTANPDYQLNNTNGVFNIRDTTNSADRLVVNTDGHIDIAGNVDFGAGIDVTGNITATGNVEVTGNIQLPTVNTYIKGNGSNSVLQVDATRTYFYGGSDGIQVRKADNSTHIITVDDNGNTTVAGNVDVGAGVDVTGNITVTGTVDGVDIAARNTLFGGLTSSSGVLSNGVTATTQSASDNSTKVATTAYTDTAISNLINGAPAALDTLNELAAAMADDAAFSTTVTNSIATKLPLAGGTLTGNLNLSSSYIDFSGSISVPSTAAAIFRPADNTLAFSTANTERLRVTNDGATLTGRLKPAANDTYGLGSSGARWANFYAVTGNFSGNITASGTVDGRDLASDGSKLDGIESGATADQSASEILTLIKTVDGVGSGLDADLLDGSSSAYFYREVASASATVGGGWMTVAENTSGRKHGEIFVSDSESGDHSFIRIDWMRSYADSCFTVINCGGHSNRITGVRVLRDSDDTYGNKKLQVYVTVSSTYRVAIKQIQNQSNWSSHTVVTPVIQASISGYQVDGSSLENLNTYNFSAEQGIQVGSGGMKSLGNVDITGNITVSGTVDGADVASMNSKLSGIESGATADQSASEILTLLKTVDGSGSGLDADLLDGVSSASFLRSDVDDTTTGHINFNRSNDAKFSLSGSNDPYIIFNEGSTQKAYIQWNSSGFLDLCNDETDESLRIKSGSNGLVFLEGGSERIVYHAGNLSVGDGGLTQNNFTNADHSKLDGIAANANNYSFPYTVSASASNGTVVQRHSSGYIFANYFNTSPDDVSSGVTKVCVETGNDGYIRHGTASAIRSFINVANGATNVTNTNQLTNGAGYTTYSANQAVDTTSSPTFNNVYAGAWFRNNDSGEGLYNQATGQHWYSDHDDWWNVAGGGAANGIRFRDDHGGTIRGYIYANNSNEVGFLDSDGHWTLKCIRDSSIEFSVNNLTGATVLPDTFKIEGCFFENAQAVSTNKTISNGYNAMSAGPITINNGVTVTVGSGEAWTIV